MRRSPILVILAVIVVAVLSALPADAQATRTWVSGVGDDANPCSRTAPCKTFAGAISKTAGGGEIDALDPGGFGAVTITKSITIAAVGVTAGVLVSGTNGIVVNAAPTDVVTLRGLDIEGLGTGLDGIHFIQGGALHVENCTIENFAQKGIAFLPASAGAQLFVLDTIIRNNTTLSSGGPMSNGGAIWVKPGSGASAEVFLNHVVMDRNLYGLRVEDNTEATVRGSTAISSLTNGFACVTAGTGEALMFMENSASSNGGTALIAGSAGIKAYGAQATITISDVTVSNNALYGLNAANGGQVVSFGNNHVSGNSPNGSPTSVISPQ